MYTIFWLVSSITADCTLLSIVNEEIMNNDNLLLVVFQCIFHFFPQTKLLADNLLHNDHAISGNFSSVISSGVFPCLNFGSSAGMEIEMV